MNYSRRLQFIEAKLQTSLSVRVQKNGKEPEMMVVIGKGALNRAPFPSVKRNI
jgi:hypothetical protein